MRLVAEYALIITALLLASVPASADVVTLTPTKDNSLFEEGDLSNGAGDHLFAGVTQDPLNIRRALLAFPVADSIPAGSTIKTVTLTLHMSWTATGPQDVTIHRLLADWGEGTSHALGRALFRRVAQLDVERSEIGASRQIPGNEPLFIPSV